MIWVILILSMPAVPLNVQSRAECEAFRSTVADLLPPTACVDMRRDDYLRLFE